MLWNKADISLFINGHHTSIADLFFRYWTNIGLGYLIIPVMMALAFVSLRHMIMSVTCFIITVGICDSIKFALNAPRPIVVLEQLHESFYHVPGVEVYSWDSFPSGHTAISFALFCLLALMVNKQWLKFLFFMAAFLVGYSRIYLAEHFITDVISASVIGVASSILSYKIMMNWKALNIFAKIDKPLINLTIDK